MILLIQERSVVRIPRTKRCIIITRIWDVREWEQGMFKWNRGKSAIYLGGIGYAR